MAVHNHKTDEEQRAGGCVKREEVKKRSEIENDEKTGEGLEKEKEQSAEAGNTIKCYH